MPQNAKNVCMFVVLVVLEVRETEFWPDVTSVCSVWLSNKSGERKRIPPKFVF
jgi:hypothetical protein